MKLSRVAVFILTALAAAVQAQPLPLPQQAEQMEDRMLTEMVQTALAREGVQRDDVSVETSRGRVRLSGFLPDGAQKRKALATASRVPGVVEVRDGLTVR